MGKFGRGFGAGLRRLLLLCPESGSTNEAQFGLNRRELRIIMRFTMKVNQSSLLLSTNLLFSVLYFE